MYLAQNICTWDTSNEISNPLQNCFTLAENTRQNQKIKHVLTCSTAFELLRSHEEQVKHLGVSGGSGQGWTQLRVVMTDQSLSIGRLSQQTLPCHQCLVISVISVIRQQNFRD